MWSSEMSSGTLQHLFRLSQTSWRPDLDLSSQEWCKSLCGQAGVDGFLPVVFLGQETAPLNSTFLDFFARKSSWMFGFCKISRYVARDDVYCSWMVRHSREQADAGRGPEETFWRATPCSHTPRPPGHRKPLLIALNFPCPVCLFRIALWMYSVAVRQLMYLTK